MIEYMQHKVFWSLPKEGKENKAEVVTFPHMLLVFQNITSKQNTCQLFEVLGGSIGMKLITAVASITHLEDRANLE